MWCSHFGQFESLCSSSNWDSQNPQYPHFWQSSVLWAISPKTCLKERNLSEPWEYAISAESLQPNERPMERLSEWHFRTLRTLVHCACAHSRVRKINLAHSKKCAIFWTACLTMMRYSIISVLSGSSSKRTKWGSSRSTSTAQEPCRRSCNSLSWKNKERNEHTR